MHWQNAGRTEFSDKSQALLYKGSSQAFNNDEDLSTSHSLL